MRLYRLRRHPLAFWATVAALALTASSAAARLSSSPAGPTVLIPVATHPVAAGTALGSDDVRWRRWPSRWLPSAPVAGAPVGRTAMVDIAAGEPLLAVRLSGSGGLGIGALVPPGERALAVPAGKAAVPLRRGDRVDVLATFDTEPGDGDPTGAVATGALVVDAGPDTVTVAVPVELAPKVAFAVAKGTVTLALAPPGRE